MSVYEVLLIVSGIVVGVSGIFLYPLLKLVSQYITTYIKDVKRLKQLENQRCKGMHSWDTIITGSKTIKYCKDCYYTPDFDNYVKKESVDVFKNLEQDREEFKAYESKRITAQALEDSLVKVLKISNEFSIHKMQKMLNDKAMGIEQVVIPEEEQGIKKGMLQ
jgi:hypothetical protein